MCATKTKFIELGLGVHVVEIEKRQAGYDYLHRVGNQKLEKVNIMTCHVCGEAMLGS